MGRSQQDVIEGSASLRRALEALFDATLVLRYENARAAVVFRNDAARRLAETTDESHWILAKDAPSEDRRIRLAKAGTSRCFLVRSVSVLWEGTPARLVLIREEKAEERDEVEVLDDDQQEARQHAHRMNTIGQLTASVVHDFNNLLTAVCGYAELATRKLDGHSALHDVEQIQRAAQHAESFAKRLLAYSRRRTIEPSHVDLNEAIADMTPILDRLLGESIEIELSLDKDTGGVKIGAGQIEQVLVNLAINARDAMPDGGRFRIETSLVDLPVEEIEPEQRGRANDRHDAPGAEEGGPRPFVRLRVSDTGGGMDEPTAKRAFEPFFSSKGPDEGTGLGLSIVREIVNDCGGAIQLESEIGVGARFDLFLPIASPSDPGIETKESAAEPTEESAGTVLVAEDEEAVRNVATAILGQQGYRVLTARDGAEALSVANAHAGTIDVLVTDIVMPRLGGVEAAKRLCQSRPDCRVLFLSGYASPERASDEPDPYVYDFLSKPFRSEDLPRKIQGLLRRPSLPSVDPKPAPNAPLGRAKRRRVGRRPTT